jgi:photosystem II stability/assembly factor-like uncharacterized protein
MIENLPLGRLTIPARQALVLGVLMVSAFQRSSAQGEVHEARFDVRQEWFESQRAYPFAQYSQNPIAAVRAMPAMRTSGAMVVTPWRSIGPFGFQTSGYYGSSPSPDGGRIRTVAIHPTNPSIIYAGSASGGVWRTTNGGASWTALTDFQCTLTTGSIAIDPVDPNIVYVGTGEPASSSGCGLLRSFDGGDSWTEINGNGVLSPTNGTRANQTYRIRVDRETAGSQTSTTVLYAASNGLHRSTTSGSAWTTVLSGFITDLEADPLQPDVYYAARANAGAANGIYRSTDNGANWSQVYSAPTTAQRIALAVTPAAPGVMAAVIVGSAMNTLVHYDPANGVTTRTATGLYNASTRLDFGSQSTYNLVLERHPVDPNIVYLGGSRVYRSTNGGQSFSLVAYELHVDWHAFEFAPSDPNVIIGGCDGGIYASYDGANSWSSRNTNIAVSQFYPGIAVHPTQQNVIAGGLQDNSSLWGFGSGYWTMSAPTGDGGFNAWSQTDPNVFWATSYSYGYVVRNTRHALSGGVVSAFRGFSGNDRKNFLPPLVIDPNNGQTLYYATYRLWRTLNDGLAWAPFTADLTKGTGRINAVAVSAADSRVIWVGTTDGNVQLSQDAGVTFTHVSGGLPNRTVTDIAADPNDAQRAVITYSGTGTGHVYITTNSGTTWTNVSVGLPDIPFNAVAIVPATTRLFVAADVGVYESGDNGATWANTGQGFPNVQVLDLVYQQATGTLYAGTYGRGLWATTVLTGAAVLRGDVNKDGAVNAFDAVLIQQALTGMLPSTGQNPMPAGDANCNGSIDSGDVLAALQFAVGSAPAALCVGKLQ